MEFGSTCLCSCKLLISTASRNSGMAFIIINKAKGWWVVQKDPEGAGNVVTDSLKSGWVPAGKSSCVAVRKTGHR